jgi:hypothetical protein
MSKSINRPLLNLSKRELNLVCNIHHVDKNKFEPVKLHVDELLSAISENRQNLHGRVNLDRIHNELGSKNIIIPRESPEYFKVMVNAECLDRSHFEWINTNNYRLCNFLWAYVNSAKTRTYNKITHNNLSLGDNKPPSRNAHELYLPENAIIVENDLDEFDGNNIFHTLGNTFRFNYSIPKNNDEIKDNVISYFDTWNVLLDEKAENIKFLENKWNFIKNSDDIEVWITLQELEKSNWAWSYIHKTKVPNWFINNGDKHDKRNGIIATFDLLHEYKYKRALLKKSMKSAWSQKAYRDKNNGKKAVSIVLSEDIIKKLDFICENTDRRKNEVVTRLIREEYEQIKKGGH